MKKVLFIFLIFFAILSISRNINANSLLLLDDKPCYNFPSIEDAKLIYQSQNGKIKNSEGKLFQSEEDFIKNFSPNYQLEYSVDNECSKINAYIDLNTLLSGKVYCKSESTGSYYQDGYQYDSLASNKRSRTKSTFCEDNQQVSKEEYCSFVRTVPICRVKESEIVFCEGKYISLGGWRNINTGELVGDQEEERKEIIYYYPSYKFIGCSFKDENIISQNEFDEYLNSSFLKNPSKIDEYEIAKKEEEKQIAKQETKEPKKVGVYCRNEDGEYFLRSFEGCWELGNEIEVTECEWDKRFTINEVERRWCNKEEEKRIAEEKKKEEEMKQAQDNIVKPISKPEF